MKFRLLSIYAGLTLLLCVSAISASVIQGSDIKTIPIKFKPGASSATVTGSVKGYAVNDYKFRASGGQTLKVKLTSKSTSVFFNVLPAENQSTGEALNIEPRPIQQTEWQGSLPKDGEYIIRVGMPRSEARRGKTFSYSLKVEIN